MENLSLVNVTVNVAVFRFGLRFVLGLVSGVVSSLIFGLGFGFALSANAQDNNNVLGLPAVPQSSTSAASGAKGSTAPSKPLELDDKSLISGQMELASFYKTDGVIVRVITQKTFVGTELRAKALKAARSVQRDISLSCGKLCTPGLMPAPALLPDNRLTFNLVLTGYVGLISSPDMINLVTAQPISPGTKAVSSGVPAQPAALAAVPSSPTNTPASTPANKPTATPATPATAPAKSAASRAAPPNPKPAAAAL